MFKIKLFPIAIAITIIVPSLVFVSHSQLHKITDNLAGIFFVPSITKQDLLALYTKPAPPTAPLPQPAATTTEQVSLPSIKIHTPETPSTPLRKIRILVIPGHDNVSWGTDYRGTKEATLTLALANKLTAYLEQDPNFDVIQARTEDGYMPELAQYFTDQKDEIAQFRAKYVAQMDSLMQAGLVTSDQTMDHHTVSSNIVTKLYGINKWANENDIDLAINIHFNDYPHSTRSLPGKYSGFTIYVPEHQYSNAAASKTVAEKVFARLHQFLPTSDLPSESAGVVEDQTLIALGSFNTLDPASILAEYSYIYEPQITNTTVRPLAINELAYETYLGVTDFFKQRTAAYPDAGIFPYAWDTDLKKGMRGNADVFAMQTALRESGFYPPSGRTLSDCPINGNFGPCTQSAVKAYQANMGINPASGYVGILTRTDLNGIYGNTRVSVAK